MSFNNSAPLSYAVGQIVKYVDAQRGLSDEAGGPKVNIVGLYDPVKNDIFDPSGVSSATPTVVRVAANTTSQQALAANTSRKGLYIVNETAANNTVFVRFGAAANGTHYTFPIYTGGVWEMGSPKWTGIVHIVTSTGTANVVVTELY